MDLRNTHITFHVLLCISYIWSFSHKRQHSLLANNKIKWSLGSTNRSAFLVWENKLFSSQSQFGTSGQEQDASWRAGHWLTILWVQHTCPVTPPHFPMPSDAPSILTDIPNSPHQPRPSHMTAAVCTTSLCDVIEVCCPIIRGRGRVRMGRRVVIGPNQPASTVLYTGHLHQWCFTKCFVRSKSSWNKILKHNIYTRVWLYKILIFLYIFHHIKVIY